MLEITPTNPDFTHVCVLRADAQSILNYLIKRPFEEVAMLVPSLTNGMPMTIAITPPPTDEPAHEFKPEAIVSDN